MRARMRGFYHVAFACRDADETRRFYEDVLGLPLVNCMRADVVPSTGEFGPYVHFFFEVSEGSYLAFFDLGADELPLPSPNTPRWVQHVALEVDAVEDVMRARERLVGAGVDVTDVVDHGFLKSVYFFDPNGLRLEVTARTEPPGFAEEAAATAHATLQDWTRSKSARQVAS